MVQRGGEENEQGIWGGGEAEWGCCALGQGRRVGTGKKYLMCFSESKLINLYWHG